MPDSILSPFLLEAFGGQCWDRLGSPWGLGGQRAVVVSFRAHGLNPLFSPSPASSPVSGEGLGVMCRVFM